MKIIIFDNENNVVDELRKINNPRIYDFNEVTWDFGGISQIENNYIFVEDNVNFEDVTEQEFLEQFKQQAIFTLARNLEGERVNYMVKGVLSEAEADFEKDKEEIKAMTDKEQVIKKVNDVENRIY